MELTVYRQAQKEREDGMIVYKGEDALPYVDDGLLFVADGLGGAGAIYHQAINREMFEPEQLMQLLFQGVYEDWSDERFQKYVLDSFRELFAVARCYSDNINNVKKSGYFGSRIVPAILLHDYFYRETLGNLEPYFEICGNRKSTVEQKKQNLAYLERRLAEVIREKLSGIAGNANLIYESRIPNLALLATTLCAVFYREEEDAVEALYFTAGDSRPYLWTEEQGLCQLLEDQEREDGGMTNYVKANGEFSIRCNYGKFQKPCILFNASDGCFDSGYFPSPMAFERLLLEKVVESSDAEEMGDRLTETFQIYGTHDDSSTIAMKMFGYDSFVDLKQSAYRRLDFLQAEYLDKMENLLDRNYRMECALLATKPKEKVRELKQLFEKESEALWTYCESMIRAENYVPYVQDAMKHKNEIEEMKRKLERYQNQTKEIIKEYYRPFMRCIGQEVRNGWIMSLGNMDKKVEDAREEYGRLIEYYSGGLKAKNRELLDIMEQICSVRDPMTAGEFDEISMEYLEDCRKFMNSFFTFLAEIGQHKQKEINHLVQAKEKSKENNRKMANMEQVSSIYTRLMYGRINMDDVKRWMGRKDFILLQGLIESIRQQRQSISREENYEHENVKKYCQEYWDNNYEELIKKIISDSGSRFSDTLHQTAKKVFEELEAPKRELEQLAERQSELFAAYDTGYGKYMRGEINDGTWI